MERGLDDALRRPPRRLRLRPRQPRQWRVALSAPGGVALSRAEPVEIREGPGWVRLDYRKDVEPGSALDFSAMGFQDVPAGKYGWLRAVGNHFEFEDLPGVPQRFHGVNLCFSANFPDHATADRRIAQVPAEVRGGALCFRASTLADDGTATLYWEIVSHRTAGTETP